MTITAALWIFFVGVLAGRAWQDRIHRKSTEHQIAGVFKEAARQLSIKRRFAGPGDFAYFARIEMSDGTIFPVCISEPPK